MSIGIDTLVLTTQDFAVDSKAHKLQIVQSYTGSELADLNKPLFADVRGNKAFYNYEADGETYAQFTIGERGLKIQCSLPKIYYGSNANIPKN